MFRLGIANPTECWTGILEYNELAPQNVTPSPIQSRQPEISVGSAVVEKSKKDATPEVIGTVEAIDGDSYTVRWPNREARSAHKLEELCLKPRTASPEPPRTGSAGAQESSGTASATAPVPVSRPVLDKKRTTLEPVKFGQKFVLGAVLWLDIQEGNSAVNGTLEICEMRARIRVEGRYDADSRTLHLEEKELLAGKNTDWQCRYGCDGFVPGTRYVLRVDNHAEGMSGEFGLPESMQIESLDRVGVLGTLKCQRKRLFHLSADAHGTSMAVSRERTSVKLSAFGGESSLAGLALSEVGFSKGVHYWEIKVEYSDDHGTVFCGIVERPPAPIYPTGVPLPNLNKWEKVPVSWGFISFRATLWMTANSATGGTEQIYGEFFETGDTVGVLLDMDVGEISFFIDALKFGEHVMRDLGPAFLPHQLGSRSPLKWNPSGEVQVLYPAIGLKRCAGDSVSVSSKYISFPSSDPQDELENLGRLNRLLRGHFKGDSEEEDAPSPSSRNNRVRLPEWYIDLAYAHYSRWSSDRYRTVPSRAGGRPVELDVSPEAMAVASAFGGIDPPFFVGERVSTLQSEGRELSTPEQAIILGSRMNRIWYSIITVSNHEGFGDGATWAFYWEPEELPLLMRGDVVPSTRSVPQRMVLSKEEFVKQACGEDWTREMDFELVRFVNLVLQREGEQDFMNLKFNREVTVSPSAAKASKGEDAVRARLAVLRLFNCITKRAMPFLSPSNANQTVEASNLSAWLYRSRRFILTSTKRTYWEAVLKATTTGTTLSSEEYVDPPQIRTVCVNRIKATPAKLAGVSSESKRMKRSVFGQLYAEMLKWPDHSFRRAYCGKGHGGQKRAFKLKLIGEGVDDYGGPYRQAFEVVCDELQNDTEWPDQRRACLLPLLIPCPNRYSGVGDVGRDKFVLNPSARSPSLLRRFEFLGKLMGTAVRHGLQLGLDFPACFWRKLVSLPVNRKHLEEIDVAFVRDIKTLESATPENFAEMIGLDRKFQVVLSDGTLVGGEDAKPITAENVAEYVRFAMQTRLQESDLQMAALKKGLAAVLPVEHFALFTAEEFETLVCGRRELDVDLLKSVTEYEGGLKETDAHVKWFWEVLEEMGAEDRTAFLKFAWARSRMPSKSELSTAFHLQQPSGGASEKPDDFLPSAQTCFFSLALPRYSSKDVLKTKFLKAIECTLMDADVRLRSAEGWAEL